MWDGPNGRGSVKQYTYKCDMCRKKLPLQERIVISATGVGDYYHKKKWDLCESCMDLLEKNVEIWYSRIKKYKK